MATIVFSVLASVRTTHGHFMYNYVVVEKTELVKVTVSFTSSIFSKKCFKIYTLRVICQAHFQPQDYLSKDYEVSI